MAKVRMTPSEAICETLLAEGVLPKPFVLEIVCDGTQLAPPFRKDALQMPTRLFLSINT